MRAILLDLEVSVTQSTDGVFKTSKPDYVFSGEFDKDDDKSFAEMCDLEYKVENLVRAFKALGCKVTCLRKEVSHLGLD